MLTADLDMAGVKPRATSFGINIENSHASIARMFSQKFEAISVSLWKIAGGATQTELRKYMYLISGFAVWGHIAPRAGQNRGKLKPQVPFLM